MKRLLSTLALVLAISSISMANSTTKSKKVHTKTVATKKKVKSVNAILVCDGNGHIRGIITSNGSYIGEGCVGCCPC